MSRDFCVLFTGQLTIEAYPFSDAEPRTNTIEQKSWDRSLIANLYCRGWTYESIGQELARYDPIGKDASTGEDPPGKPFSKAHVFKELKVIRKEWLRTQLGKYAERQAVELSKIDAVEQEAWAAWRRSVGTRTETTEYIMHINGRLMWKTGSQLARLSAADCSASARMKTRLRLNRMSMEYGMFILYRARSQNVNGKKNMPAAPQLLCG